jgi:hypothetical protein
VRTETRLHAFVPLIDVISAKRSNSADIWTQIETNLNIRLTTWYDLAQQTPTLDVNRDA